MKYEEHTDFMIDWGEGQHVRIHDGLVAATTLLKAGPRPLQIVTTSTTYMALGARIPERWLTLFEKSVLPSPVQVEVHHQARTDLGYLHQSLTLGPCEHGEHLHANVIVAVTLHVGEQDDPDQLAARLTEAWRTVGDLAGELQDDWVLPFLDVALDIETLHGGEF